MAEHCDVDFGAYSDDCDPVEFYHSKTVTARKTHRCEECGATITAGESYQRSRNKFEGQFESYAVCLPCVETATEFRGSVVGLLWEWFQEEWADGAHLQPCLDRLATARAKDRMRAQWLKWRGLSSAPLPDPPQAQS